MENISTHGFLWESWFFKTIGTIIFYGNMEIEFT